MIYENNSFLVAVTDIPRIRNNLQMYHNFDDDDAFDYLYARRFPSTFKKPITKKTDHLF